ncbi:MAG TPA: hypothetical protein VGU20_28390 [Stellaceae bacterium]|nr:hypothetical protein [Stellaceae bacterium]
MQREENAVTPHTLGTILAALARDPDDPPFTVITDLSVISATSVEQIEAQIREIIEDEERETSDLPFY